MVPDEARTVSETTALQLRKKPPLSYPLAALISDLAAVTLSILATVASYTLIRGGETLLDPTHLFRILSPVHILILAGIFVYFASRRHYSLVLPLPIVAKQIIFATLYGLFAEGFYAFWVEVDIFQTDLALSFFFLGFFLLSGRGIAYFMATNRNVAGVPTLLIADREKASTVKLALENEGKSKFTVVSTIEPLDADESPQAKSKFEQTLADRCDSWGIKHVILAPSSHSLEDDSWGRIVRFMFARRVPYTIVTPVGEVLMSEMEVLHLFTNNVVLLSPRNRLTDPLAAAMKRTFDLGISLTATLLMAPFLLLIAGLVKLDGGPAFYGHRRIGRNGKEFRCLKFRTMHQDADQKLNQLLRSSPALAEEWKRSRKLRNDPRVTRIGDFLRRFSFDELPQLFNVIRGEMSLVGPRPVTLDELQQHYGEYEKYYYATRPGITGLWQISGRSDVDYNRRIQLDSWYVRTWSLWADVTILFQTVHVLASRKGAY